MWQYQKTDELYHHGVFGMKWGHRKAKTTSTKQKIPGKYTNKYWEERRKNSRRITRGAAMHFVGRTLTNNGKMKVAALQGKTVPLSYARRIQAQGLVGYALRGAGTGMVVSGAYRTHKQNQQYKNKKRRR